MLISYLVKLFSYLGMSDLRVIFENIALKSLFWIINKFLNNLQKIIQHKKCLMPFLRLIKVNTLVKLTQCQENPKILEIYFDKSRCVCYCSFPEYLTRSFIHQQLNMPSFLFFQYYLTIIFLVTQKGYSFHLKILKERGKTDSLFWFEF